LIENLVGGGAVLHEYPSSQYWKPILRRVREQC